MLCGVYGVNRGRAIKKGKRKKRRLQKFESIRAGDRGHTAVSVLQRLFN